jgi:hypothetical protein
MSETDCAPSDRLRAAIQDLPDDRVTLANIVTLIGRDGLMLLTALLSVVFMVPVSIPGVSTVFGSAILLIGVSRLLRRDLWLPRTIAQRSIPTPRLRNALERGLRIFRKLERLSKPGRLEWATSGGAQIVNDAALIAGAVLMIAPFGFVPFSNTLPALALICIAIGSVQRDGACIAIGHAALVATVAYFAALIGGGGMAIVAAVERVFQ